MLQVSWARLGQHGTSYTSIDTQVTGRRRHHHHGQLPVTSPPGNYIKLLRQRTLNPAVLDKPKPSPQPRALKRLSGTGY